MLKAKAFGILLQCSRELQEIRDLRYNFLLRSPTPLVLPNQLLTCEEELIEVLLQIYLGIPQQIILQRSTWQEGQPGKLIGQFY